MQLKIREIPVVEPRSSGVVGWELSSSHRCMHSGHGNWRERAAVEAEAAKGRGGGAGQRHRSGQLSLCVGVSEEILELMWGDLIT